MVKKILFVMLVAIATFATSSCSKDDPAAIATYTLESNIDFANFSAEDQQIIQELKDMLPGPQTTVNTLNFMKTIADELAAKFASNMSKIAQGLKGNQTVTFKVNVFKGATASGSPVYTKTVIATKNGVELK